MPSPQQALEALTQDPDLARLEALLQRFNLFEAVGVLRQELRHSDLLATFLNPRQSHGLGTLFLTELLRVVAPSTDISNLKNARVEREWHNIDILVVDDTARLAVIIENKIDTGEIPGQLSRYYADVRSHFPEHEIIALFLTRNGDAPSDDPYLAVSYSQVCQILEKIIAERQETLDADVAIVLKHYAQMLRRHIVSDSDVAVLCREIYRKHKQALDLVIEHRPDRQAQIGQYVVGLIEQNDTLDLGTVARGWVVFVPSEWHRPRSITPNPPHLYLEFHLRPSDLNILCTLSPGADTKRRADIFEMARRHHFTGCPAKSNRGHCRLSTISLLRVEDYDKTQEEIEAIISENWEAYLRDELPRIIQAVRDEKWLSELPV